MLSERGTRTGLMYEGDRTLAALTAWIEAQTGARTMGAQYQDKKKEDL